MKKVLFLLVLFLSQFSVNTFAAVRTWDGGGANINWNTAENWVDDIIPVAGDDLVFPANAAQFDAVNLFPNTIFSSLTIEGGSYLIFGNALRVTNGVSVLGGDQRIHTPLVITTPITVTAAQGSIARFSGIFVFAEPAGRPYNLTLEGAGEMVFQQFSGPGKTLKESTGAVLVESTNGYTGAVTHNNGILRIDAAVPQAVFTVNSSSSAPGYGSFGGNGSIGKTDIIRGTITSGTLTTPGILNINQSLNFTANGGYLCRIGRTTPELVGHDQLNVTGTVTLANARLVTLPWNAFRPAMGDTFVILKNDGTDAINGTFLNAPEGATIAGAQNTAYRITYQGGDGNDVAITTINKAPFDFDGDGKTDLSIFRPSTKDWWYRSSINGAQLATQWGNSTDLIAPADYDGDNKTDIAVFRPSDGTWYILNSTTGAATIMPFGSNGDVPVPNDFDGDGRADIAVFRPSTGVWYEFRSLGNQVFIQQFGLNGDIPLLVDYDGDGLGDLAVYRPADGVWHFWKSLTSSYVAFPFGIATDKPVPGDYDGDGRTDAAIFRATADPNQPDFYILLSGPLTFQGYSWGVAGDIPVVADYDGDGKTDVSVFRPGTNDWFLLRSTDGFISGNFGQAGDVAVPGAFMP